MTDEAIVASASAAFDVGKPMDNTDFELVWRKRVIRTLVTGALQELRGDDVRAMRFSLARRELLYVA